MTVNEAISKGVNKIKKPMLPFVLITNGISFFVSYQLMNPLIIFIALAITALLCFLWWSISITKWRIWAFSNCRNVHKLKKQAIKHKLIGPDGSIFEKLEIRSKKQIEQLKKIDKKFELEDVLEEVKDDKSLERETKIYYSKLYYALEWLIPIMSFSSGLCILYKSNSKSSFFSGTGYFLIVLSLVLAYFLYTKINIGEAYIILNSRGVKTLKTPFIPWENIEYIHTKRKGIGKHEKWYLEFKLNNNISENKLNEIEISALDKKPLEIEDLIALYKQRNRIG